MIDAGSWNPEALAGKIAVVTGAGRGIGRAVAIGLAASGATVALTARSEQELLAVAAEIRAGGGEAVVRAGDITDDTFVEELFAGVRQDLGRLDILINNAGMATFAPIADVSPADLRAALELNTIAPYACTRKAIELMRTGSDDGHIVNVGSVEAYWVAQGESGTYPASKFALRALTLAVTKELKQAGSGIRVSMVNPGGVDTTLVNPHRQVRPSLLDPAIVAQAVMHTVTAPPGVHVLDTILVSQVASFW